MATQESSPALPAFCQHPLDPETSSSVGLAFALAVQSAQSLDDFAAQRAAIQKAMRVNTLRYSEGVLLQNFLTERAEQLAQRTNAEPSTRLPANKLHSRLRKGEPCLVIIDGHNLLFRLSVLFLQWFDAGRPSLQAREELTQRLLQRVIYYETLCVELWFDGDDESKTEVHQRLVVNYSGGKGKDRADRRIISRLRGSQAIGSAIATSRLGADTSELIFVVTDDLGLARRIRKTTVMPIACGEFRGFVLDENQSPKEGAV